MKNNLTPIPFRLLEYTRTTISSKAKIIEVVKLPDTVVSSISLETKLIKVKPIAQI